MELQTQALNDFLLLLKYESPKVYDRTYIKYKNVDMIDFDSIDTVTTGQFRKDLENQFPAFTKEAINNVYSPLFNKYIVEANLQFTKALSILQNEYLDTIKFSLIMADIEDLTILTEQHAYTVIPKDVFMNMKTSTICGLIKSQIYACENALKWIKENYNDYISVPEQELITKASNIIEGDKKNKVVNANLKKKELVTLFWLLNYCNFLKFENNKHLADFIQNNFTYSRAGNYMPMENVETEISRLEDYKIEEMQKELLEQMRSDLKMLDDSILEKIATAKIKK